MGLKNLGAQISDNADLVYEDYIDVVKAADLTSGQVDDRINSGLAGYATKSYVDAQDALNATQAYVDAGDAARVRTSTKDVPNGVPGLDTGGRVSGNRINLPSDQKYNAGPWSPPAYPGATSVTTETTLFTCPVTDPGFPYKLMVFGQLEASSNLNEYPIVYVRQGSSTGPIVATGAGIEQAIGDLQTESFTAAGAYVYDIPIWATHVDLVLLGAGEAGGGGSFFGNGAGGRAGSFATVTLQRGPGLDIPLSTTEITGSVGAGGGGWGGNTTATATGASPLTAAGGAGGVSPTDPVGQSPGTLSFNSQSYVGGVAQSNNGFNGNAPGGGGGGGGFNGPGGGGSNGAAWFFAYTVPNIMGGPVTLIPTNLAAQSILTGATTLYVRMARSGPNGTISASGILTNLHVLAVPA